jgi:hypothetical protein
MKIFMTVTSGSFSVYKKVKPHLWNFNPSRIYKTKDIFYLCAVAAKSRKGLRIK